MMMMMMMIMTTMMMMMMMNITADLDQRATGSAQRR